MTFRFYVGEEEMMAFAVQFMRRSTTIRKTRRWIRLVLPLIMLVFAAYSTYRHGFRSIVFGLYAGVSLLWFLFYPLRYDRNALENMRKHLREPSQVKARGDYMLEISGEGLRSTSPVGSGFVSWAGVEGAVLTDEFLFIFMTGSSGHPIRRAQVGMEASQAAHDYVNAHAAAGGAILPG